MEPLWLLPPVEKCEGGAPPNVRPVEKGALSESLAPLSASRVDPEDVKLCDAEPAAFAREPICPPAAAPALARVSALILLTDPFAFAT